MEELHSLMPDIRFEIFTLVPEWFFSSSISFQFGYHPELTDIGLIQKTPLIEDIEETINHLDGFIPFRTDTIKRLADTITHLDCCAIISDISPLGISIARMLGIPSILIENFTWDWIYEGYPEYTDRFGRHIDYLKEVYAAADYHIQTEPICNPINADLKTPPVSRRIRRQPDEVRGILNIPDGARIVMLTISGANMDGYNFLNEIQGLNDLFFVIPCVTPESRRNGNLIFLSQDSGILHHDLVNAVDVIIGKLGYSTVAEVYHAGVPFGYIKRERFRESERLEWFCKSEMMCHAIGEDEFTDGRWIPIISGLLGMERVKKTCPNGAGMIAGFILNTLKGVKGWANR
ncbi:MAG: hypothetical protein Fur0020_12540 [Thermodesulfovibrionia bacterium]